MDEMRLTIEGREIVCRRPTHGELDLTMLQRLLQVLVGYREQMIAIEENPPPDGAAVRLANLLALCNDALDEIRKRVRRFLAKVAGPETAEWFDAGSEVEVTTRAAQLATALVLELAPPARLGK